MTVTIVVARYKEDVEWTKQFSNVIIYNKGPPLPKGYNEIRLDNVGREGHTYYHHIYENYKNLDDYIVFLQGNPFDHSPKIIEELKNIVNNKNLNIDFKLLATIIFRCNINEDKTHPDLPLKFVYMRIFNDIRTDVPYEFGAGGQFMVSKKNILKRSKWMYFNIIQMLKHDIDPIEGYVLERFHKLILG